jgi:predicted NBD/HSP70 family sugar kinase
VIFLALDLGGTRLKVGVHNGWWDAVQALPTPDSLPELIATVNMLVKRHQPDSWGMTIPGRISTDHKTWLRAKLPFALPATSFDEVASWFKFPPAVLVSDTTALAYGILEATGCCVQISTGIGARSFNEEKLLYGEDGQPLGSATSSVVWQDQEGRSADYRTWLGHTNMQSLLPMSLRGIEWRKLAPELPDCHLLAARQYVQDVLRDTGQRHVVLAGGGAVALQPRLTPLLRAAGISHHFEEDTILPGLRGLHLLSLKAA